MAIELKGELGKIVISRRVFARLLMDIFDKKYMSGRGFLATKKGKEISSTGKSYIGELASNLRLELVSNKNNSIEGENKAPFIIEIPVITKFGASIKGLCEDLIDEIISATNKFPIYPKVIIIKVVGVKSTNIIKREVIMEYEYDDKARRFTLKS